MHLSKVSGQDDRDPGEKKVVENGNSTSGEFIVRNVSLNHWKKVKEDQHWGVVGAVKNELTSVSQWILCMGTCMYKFYSFFKKTVKMKKNLKIWNRQRSRKKCECAI